MALWCIAQFMKMEYQDYKYWRFSGINELTAAVWDDTPRGKEVSTDKLLSNSLYRIFDDEAMKVAYAGVTQDELRLILIQRGITQTGNMLLTSDGRVYFANSRYPWFLDTACYMCPDAVGICDTYIGDDNLDLKVWQLVGETFLDDAKKMTPLAKANEFDLTRTLLKTKRKRFKFIPVGARHAGIMLCGDVNKQSTYLNMEGILPRTAIGTYSDEAVISVDPNGKVYVNEYNYILHLVHNGYYTINNFLIERESWPAYINIDIDQLDLMQPIRYGKLEYYKLPDITNLYWLSKSELQNLKYCSYINKSNNLLGNTWCVDPEMSILVLGDSTHEEISIRLDWAPYLSLCSAFTRKEYSFKHPNLTIKELYIGHGPEEFRNDWLAITIPVVVNTLNMPSTIKECKKEKNYGDIVTHVSTVEVGTLDLSRVESGDIDWRCTVNESIRFPDSTKEIGNGCTIFGKVKRVYFPDTITKIGESVFAFASTLECFRYPEYIECITLKIIRFCYDLKSITLPKNSQCKLDARLINQFIALSDDSNNKEPLEMLVPDKNITILSQIDRIIEDSNTKRKINRWSSDGYIHFTVGGKR